MGVKPGIDEALREAMRGLANGEIETFLVQVARRDDAGQPASFRAVVKGARDREVFTFLRTPAAATRTVMQKWRDEFPDPEIESLLE